MKSKKAPHKAVPPEEDNKEAPYDGKAAEERKDRDKNTGKQLNTRHKHTETLKTKP